MTKARERLLLSSATSLSQSLRLPLEFTAAATVWMVVVAVASESLQSAVFRSMTLEAFAMVQDPSIDMVVYRAETGVWPSSSEDIPNTTLMTESDLTAVIDRIELESSGALTVHFEQRETAAAISEKQLSFRPSISVEGFGERLIWVCAGGSVTRGFEAVGIDATSIRDANLPSICRER